MAAGRPAGQPRAWLVSTGRFKAIDRLRRRARFDAALGELAARLDDQAPDPADQDDQLLEDDRLRLIFTCCHPALSPDAEVAMTLREVCDLTTDEIAQGRAPPGTGGPRPAGPAAAPGLPPGRPGQRRQRADPPGRPRPLGLNRARIAEGAALLRRASSAGLVGPYTPQAAIAAAHAEAPTAEATDWARIAGLYDLLPGPTRRRWSS